MYASGEAFLELGKSCAEYDMVFLDVEMPGLNGIETARELRKYSARMFIVFVTAHIDYSPKGYEVEAIRYILKDSDTLRTDIEGCLGVILSRIRRSSSVMRFTFREGEMEINLERILYLESYKHIVRFIMEDKGHNEYTMYGKLDEAEDKLKGHHFVRIHKSILVNMHHIKRMSSGMLVLDDGSELSISKSKSMEAKSEYIKYKCRMEDV